MAAEPRHVVWISPVSWDGIPGSDRQLAQAMTSYAQVLWVDPQLSVVASARQGGGLSSGIVPSLERVSDGITRLRPIALPGLTRPGVRASTAPLLRAQLSWALRRTGIRPAAVVMGYLEDVLGRQPGAVNVLYCTDDHVAGAGLMGLSADRLRAQERRAAARADVVAVVSPALAEHWAALGADPVLIPNGCSPAAAPLPAADAGLPRPVVGLVGQLSERIDMDILEALAGAGVSLLIVGPHDPRWEPERFAALTARPGVRHTGRVPGEEVPSYLAAIDIGLTPYTGSPFNRASFPLKTLEYLAAGRPVVSTDLPGSRWLADDLAGAGQPASEILALAATPAGIVSAVRAMAAGPGGAGEPAGTGGPLAEGEQRRREQCWAFATRHSWARRAGAMAEAIGLRQVGQGPSRPAAYAPASGG